MLMPKKSRAFYVMVPEDDPQWCRFWDAYPRRCAKKDARKAWAKLNPSPQLVTEMIEALLWQVPLHRWDGEKMNFAPYPASWLNGERWTDAKPEPKRRAMSDATATVFAVLGVKP